MQAVPTDAPVMKAWKNHEASEEFANTLQWAGKANLGGLWACFYAGFFACAVRNSAKFTDAVDELGLIALRAVAENLGIRHKPGAQPADYLKAFLTVSRPLAYATQDDSWGEFEKEFGHIVCRLIDAEAELRALKGNT